MGSGTGVGVAVAADSPAPAGRGAAVALTPAEVSGVGSEVEPVVESDEHAIATKIIKDRSAKIGFILVLTKQTRLPDRRAVLLVSNFVG
ncbi:MAG: hypothetical protein BZY87_02870 [SAR202 cluster bacterium Io17-Chloro-G6]|nr:MAG: hypothetical protein BZY87_02870 [SAR202 cluster bacterium Io17-Chloro-G6]